MVVRVIVMGMVVIGSVSLSLLPFSNPALQSFSDLAVLVALVPSIAPKPCGAYCAAAPAEANVFAGLDANFFFAVSTQAANS